MMGMSGAAIACLIVTSPPLTGFSVRLSRQLTPSDCDSTARMRMAQLFVTTLLAGWTIDE
ncbi:MAG: hypothetical protein V3U55_05775 [Mycobacterium sp.]